ncbi:hypothetical protein [Rhodovulum sp. PH10]|uniref:hypothetical protein n=1 Tax=Rhodovulum sp. PH10 TaxID=1187851 RepID=UPI0005900BA8|nr:hypothetical protein [Rhodovulum sp. PH10]
MSTSADLGTLSAARPCRRVAAPAGASECSTGAAPAADAPAISFGSAACPAAPDAQTDACSGEDWRAYMPIALVVLAGLVVDGCAIVITRGG